MPGDEVTLRPGEEVSGVNPDDLKRLVIRGTVEEHLDKEIRLAAQKREVKVLSLFFINSVELSHQLDEDGNTVKGTVYRDILFQEECWKLAKNPDYQTPFEKVDLDSKTDGVHNAYFSIDKKGG